jgi:hypothetical protein
MKMKIQMVTSRVFGGGTLPGGCDCTVLVLMPSSTTMVLECDPNAGHIWVSQSQQEIELPYADTSTACDAAFCCSTMQMDCDVVVRQNCWVDGAVEVAFVPSSDYAEDIAASNECIEYYRPYTFRGTTRLAYRMSIRLEDITATGAPSCKYLWQRTGTATLYGSWNGTQTDDTVGIFDYEPVIPLQDWSAEAIGLTSGSTAEERYNTAYRYTDWCTTRGNYIRVDWVNQYAYSRDECKCGESREGECDLSIGQTTGPTYYGLDLQPGLNNACRCQYSAYTAAIKFCSGATVTYTGSGNTGTKTVSQLCVDDYWTLDPGPFDTTSTWTRYPGSMSFQYTAGQAEVFTFVGPSESLVKPSSYQCYPCLDICDRNAGEECCEQKVCTPTCALTTISYTLTSTVAISAVSCPVY